MAREEVDIPEHLREPPAHLSPQAAAFFNHETRGDKEFDAAARTLLIAFCEAQDLVTMYGAELRKLASPCFKDKAGQPRIHPFVKEHRAAMNELGKLFRLLGYDQQPDDQIPLFGRRN